MNTLFRYLLLNVPHNNHNTFYIVGNTVYVRNEFLLNCRDTSMTMEEQFDYADHLIHDLTGCEYCVNIDAQHFMLFVWDSEIKRYLGKVRTNRKTPISKRY